MNFIQAWWRDAKAMPFDLAIAQFLPLFLLAGLLGALAWLFRKHL